MLSTTDAAAEGQAFAKPDLEAVALRGALHLNPTGATGKALQAFIREGHGIAAVQRTIIRSGFIEHALPHTSREQFTNGAGGCARSASGGRCRQLPGSFDRDRRLRQHRFCRLRGLGNGALRQGGFFRSWRR